MQHRKEHARPRPTRRPVSKEIRGTSPRNGQDRALPAPVATVCSNQSRELLSAGVDLSRPSIPKPVG
jgi:hypothetical protein